MRTGVGAASSRGMYMNTGRGPTFQPLDIGHPDYVALVDPDTAFWSLVLKEKVGQALAGGSLLKEYRQKLEACSAEMETLRFGLRPSAVYFNPTDRCNLNCQYCYIPEAMRRGGVQMSEARMMEALAILKAYFGRALPAGRLPQVVFHGAEPLLNRDALFAAIERYRTDFRFGVQTNGTLLDESAVDFLTSRDVSLGLSLDGHVEEVADRTRRTWSGAGASRKVVQAIERLRGYGSFSVLCTVSKANLRELPKIVDFFHDLEVPYCMLNPLRCTQERARGLKPPDEEAVPHYLAALDRTYERYEETGRKLIVVNFANILLSLVAPAARRLMCDISPCGGGRCFFALSASGDLYPCSEFIGLEEFCGGNLFRGELEKALASPAFRTVTDRKVEGIEPCARCAIRHFCGSPCPAEAHAMNGGMSRPGAFCEFYEEQVRYAFRLIADGKEAAYLYDDWDRGMTETLNISSL